MTKFKDLTPTARIIIIIALVLVVCVIIAAGAYWYIASKILSRVYEPDLIISSPDGQYELVVREWSCLGGSGADVYIRETEWYNSWKMNEIGTVRADDYYYPFANGTYYVEWEIDKVTIYYYKCLSIENVNDRSTWRGIVSYNLD